MCALCIICCNMRGYHTLVLLTFPALTVRNYFFLHLFSGPLSSQLLRSNLSSSPQSATIPSRIAGLSCGGAITVPISLKQKTFRVVYQEMSNSGQISLFSIGDMLSPLEAWLWPCYIMHEAHWLPMQNMPHSHASQADRPGIQQHT